MTEEFLQIFPTAGLLASPTGQIIDHVLALRGPVTLTSGEGVREFLDCH